MNRLSLLLILILGIASQSNAQYSWVNQYQNSNITFNDVFMVNNFEGYAVGTDGSFSQVYKTSNGGNPWVGNYTPPGESNLVACYFTSKDHGFVVSEDSDVYETFDGGVSWDTIYNEISVAVAYNITMAGSRLIITRNGEILYTDNGGINWFSSAVPFAGAAVVGISFYDNLYGVICGPSGQIAYTTTAGIIWTSITPQTTLISTDFNSVHALNVNQFICVGAGGAICKTIDNGSIWTLPGAPNSNELTDVHFYNGANGVICGANNTIFYSTDAGDNWVNKPALGSSANFKSARVTNDITAFVVGDIGEIWVSPDTIDIAIGQYIGPSVVCAGVPFEFQITFTNVGNDTTYNETFNAINNTNSIPGFPITYNGSTLPGETDTVSITLTLSAGSNSITYWTQNSVNAANNFADTVIIAVAPSPVDIAGGTFFCPGDTVVLDATGGNSYTWQNLSGNADATNPTQTVYPTQTITYYVDFDQDPCFLLDSVVLTLDSLCDSSLDSTQVNPAISYAFSPNFDGVNDVLVLDFLDLNAEVNEVTIYNRWGDEVFAALNYNNTDSVWDGYFKKRLSPAGTYYFIARSSNATVVRGWIQLVR
jgi:gliding motility-associated-like protein